MSDIRNIHDRFKWWDNVDIRDNLAETAVPFVNVFCNILGDFNLSSGVRNTNWFNAERVIIAGRRKWDRRGAVGVQNYTPVEYFPDIPSAVDSLRQAGYRIVAAEITPDALPLPSYAWQTRSAVLYGEEGLGLAQDVLDLCDDVVYIPGRGSVRSLNVATTSGIFTYDYASKTGAL